MGSTARSESQRLRGLIDTLAAFVGLMTPDGILVEANRAALDAAGLTPDDVLNKPFWDAYWWSYDEAVQAQLRDAVARAASGEVVQYDVPVRGLDDEPILIEFRVAPLRDERGDITHLVPSAVVITDRVRLERELREREAQLRAALAIARMGTFQLDVQSGAVEASDATRALFEVPAGVESTVAMFLRRVHADDRSRVREAMDRSIHTGEAHEIEYRIVDRHGEERWLLSRADVLPAPHGGGARLLGALVDISDRKRSEALLAERFAELEDIYAHAPVGLCVVDRDFRFVRVNRRLAEINGVSVIDHLGRKVREIVPDLADETERMLTRLFETGQPMLDLEISGETPAQPAVERVWRENWHPIRNERGEVVGVNVVALEVTSEVAAERALHEHRDRLEELVRERTRQVRALAASLSQAEQQERARIAQVLHDDVQQLLYALQIQVKALRRAPDPARVQNELEGAQALLQKAIDVTRGVSVAMNPPVLRREGLAAALRWLATDMRDRYELDVSLDVDATDSDALSESERSLLLHSTRELLFNVVKHAGVHRAALRAARRNGTMTIEVRDEGRGFNPQVIVERGVVSFGLTTIRERLELNGGSLTASSAPGQGTSITITLPITSP